MMLNPLRPSAATTAAVEQAVVILRKAFDPERAVLPAAEATALA